MLITRVNINAWASGARTRSRGRIFGWSHFIIKLVFCVCGGVGMSVSVHFDTSNCVRVQCCCQSRGRTHKRTHTPENMVHAKCPTSQNVNYRFAHVFARPTQTQTNQTTPTATTPSTCFLSTTYDMAKIINTYLTQATYDHNVAGVDWVVGVERLCKGGVW